MDVLIPPDIPVAEIEWRILDNTAVSSSPLNGVTTTFTRPGTRWGARLSFRNLKDRDRARLISIIAAARGRSGRVYFTSAADPARTGGSSFPELFANADFSAGTTGWMTQNCTLAVRDRVMRLTSVRTTASASAFFQSPAVTAYRPLVVRGHFGPRNRTGTMLGVFANGASSYLLDRQGPQAVAWVPSPTSAVEIYPAVYDGNSNITTTGDWLDVPFASLANCALVDNAPNVLTQTNDFSHADWTKAGATVTANSATAPDGTTSADRIVEDTSTGDHYVLQSKTRTNVAADWCFAIALAPGDVGGLRDRAMLRIVDAGSVNSITAHFDLLNGAVSVAASAGGSASNARAFIKPIGRGYYYCAIVGRMPASDTTIRGVVNLVENPSTISYTGASSRNIAAWRGTLAQSSVPVRLSDRTIAAPNGDSQSGGGLCIKGLPPSMQDIRAAGDMVEITLPTYSQLVRLTAALDSDAAGLGYLQFENPVRTSPADNSAVIFNQPMMRGILSEGPMWPTRPGLFSDFDLDLIEDIAP